MCDSQQEISFESRSGASESLPDFKTHQHCTEWRHVRFWATRFLRHLTSCTEQVNHNLRSWKSSSRSEVIVIPTLLCLSKGYLPILFSLLVSCVCVCVCVGWCKAALCAVCRSGRAGNPPRWLVQRDPQTVDRQRGAGLLQPLQRVPAQWFCCLVSTHTHTHTKLNLLTKS